MFVFADAKIFQLPEIILRSKRNDPTIELVIVFGKNEENIQRSLQYEDFTFFREFPNIEIRYQKNLHAKYYANENEAILTSMNLYSYSQDHNIEVGIWTNTSSLVATATNIIGIGENIDNDAYNYFGSVVKNARLLFEKRPIFEKKLFGLSKKYKTSEVLIDNLSDVFRKQEYNIAEKAQIVNEQIDLHNYGYCIRTGKKIPFNIEKPLCDSAYRKWAQFGIENYSEKFCHFTGEESFGETSYAKPVLHKNWKKACELFEINKGYW